MNVKALYVSKKAVMNSSMIIGIIVGTMLLTVMSITPRMAHPSKDRPDPDKIISVLKERLQLTDEQAEKMRAIFDEQDKKGELSLKKFTINVAVKNHIGEKKRMQYTARYPVCLDGGTDEGISGPSGRRASKDAKRSSRRPTRKTRQSTPSTGSNEKHEIKMLK